MEAISMASAWRSGFSKKGKGTKQKNGGSSFFWGEAFGLTVLWFLMLFFFGLVLLGSICHLGVVDFSRLAAWLC